MPFWTDLVAPRYFELKAGGASDDAAAAIVKDEWPDLLGGNSVSSVSRRMRQWRSGLADREGGFAVPPPIAKSDPSHLTGLEVPYQDCHVWNDCHIPLHVPEVMELSLERAFEDRIRCLVIGGDFMDMGWASTYTSWGNHSPSQTAAEFEVARGVLLQALKVFDTIYVIPGNHDGTRFKHMSGGTLGFRQLMDMVLGGAVHPGAGKRIAIGERRWIVLKGSPRGDWRITHPVSARAAPLSLAQALALKHRQNILTAHQHYLAMGFDRYSGYLIADGGHMQDESLTDYKLEVDTTHSCWSPPGYIELHDGFPSLITPFGPR